MKMHIRLQLENWYGSATVIPTWLYSIGDSPCRTGYGANKREVVANALATHVTREVGVSFARLVNLAYFMLPGEIGAELEVGDILAMLELAQ